MDTDISARMYELLRLIEPINKLAMTLPGVDGGVFALPEIGVRASISGKH